jgi:hypothetical protein
MDEELKNIPIDMPEGKMELSLRILGNEFIGIKMVVDDFKMKWAIIGVVGIAILLGAVSYFGPAIQGLAGG